MILSPCHLNKFWKPALLVIVLILSNSSSQSQAEQKEHSIIGGACEGCEAIYEYDTKLLTPIDTLPLFKTNEPQLHITGTVYQRDGKTPAKNIILYIYQTNRDGIYETQGSEKGWAKRHGFIRGWVKTGQDGKYTFYTFKPASYPNRKEPEHIHITVKEPNKNEYYLDEYVFDDDPLLTPSKRKELKNRGGSGIIKPILKNGVLTIHRDLILGLNIPNYE